MKYKFDYEYDEKFAHRLIHAGNLNYHYDANGNVTCEQDGSFESNGDDVKYHKSSEEADGVYSSDYGWALFRDSDSAKTSSRYRRTYTWNERNQLICSKDASFTTNYIYGQDGQRTNKYTARSETLCFNKMWTLHTDSGNSVYGGQNAKNIYLGDTRIVTKLASPRENTIHEEYYKQYYYHSDHLGSASLISDYKGDEYQRIEYTPYGKTWVEKTQNTGLEYLPYKFTGQMKDEETGNYYIGARYLQPQTCRWLSCDSALGEYLIPDKNKKYGVFDYINLNLYHYGHNNPIKYTDPDGNCSYSTLENNPDEVAWAKEQYNKSETERFASILRDCIGAEYSHERMPTSDKMDCSGMLVYALDSMGYEVPKDVTANKIANGTYDWISVTDKVDNSKQGKAGMLNLYKFGSTKVVHVNYGVGTQGVETENQIMDASEGDTWQSLRNPQSKQNPKAAADRINKTWAPFSTRTKPDYQATIDFNKLKRKEDD